MPAMNSNLHPLQLKLFYGRNLHLKDALIAGIPAGALGYILFESGLCEAAIPPIPLGALILVVTPLLFLSILAKPAFSDIQNPRRNDITFLVGISHEHRIAMFMHEMKRVAKFTALFTIGASIINLLLCLLFRQDKNYILMPGLAICSILEIYALAFGSIVLVRSGIYGATPKDSSSIESNRIFANLQHVFVNFTGRLSNIFVSPLRGRIRLIAKRQLTDLFRYNLASSLIFPWAALLLIISLNYLLKETPRQFIQFLYSIGAYIFATTNFEGLYDSSCSLKRLPDYSFSTKEIFVGNCYLFLSLTFLFPVAYLIFNIRGVGNIVDAIGILQFLSSYVYLILICGSWHTLSCIPDVSKVSKGLLFGYVLVIIPSIFIPIYGILFPAILYILFFITEKNILSSETFHHQFHT
jgi:hypothetical protein